MDKNEQGIKANDYCLSILKAGEWRQSITGQDKQYLSDRGQLWVQLKACDDYQVNSYPFGVKS